MKSFKSFQLKIFTCSVLIVYLCTSTLGYAQRGENLPSSFVTINQRMPLSQSLNDYIRTKLIPRESIYFTPGIGLDANSGMPYDHIRIRLVNQLLGERGNYTAASKLSLSVSYLLGVIEKKSVFQHVKITPEKAEVLLEKALKTILDYIKRYPENGGFLPWVDIRPNGTIAPANTKIPSLDNGQLTWALAAVAIALKDSAVPRQKKIAEMAQAIMDDQNYAMFYDSQAGLLHGTIQKDIETGKWIGDKSYYLNDMFEGVLAVLWAVLHGQVSEKAWYNLKIPTVDYESQYGERITTFQGFRASFHEHWALIFLPLMDSALAPLYENYLYVQADYANKHKLPGFLSTAYDPRGTYRQMGIPGISYQPVDRSDVSVVFATALAMLISPFVGAVWLKNIYEFENILTPFGAVESVGEDGYADIFTADGKGLTLVAASGGVVAEVKKYLLTHNVPGTDTPMYYKLMELLLAKYKQINQSRQGEPIYFPIYPIAFPPLESIQVRSFLPFLPGPEFDITSHLQKGHLHGKNVRSVHKKTLEDDVEPGGIFQFEFEIPAYYSYFDQWAFRGTYVDQAVGISEMRYLSFSIPAMTPPLLYEIEIKSDDIILASAVIDTTEGGFISLDGKWKRFAKRIQLIPEASYKPFNYFSIAIHDPRYLLGKYSYYGREGTIVLKDIRLAKYHPFEPELAKKEMQTGKVFGDFDLISYWRLTHGNLSFEKNERENTYHFKGGLGWRGGYTPYTDISEFEYLYLKLRNTSKKCNCLYVELKNEGRNLAKYKIPIRLPADSHWHIYKIKLPKKTMYPLNYFALSDPLGSFDLAAVSLTYASLPIEAAQTLEFSPSRRPVRCEYQC